MSNAPSPHAQRTAAILALLDAGLQPVAILAALPGLTRDRLYWTLRRERPNRKRAPRPCTSGLPAQMLALDAVGIGPVRIGQLLGVERQYVYRVLKASKRGQAAAGVTEDRNIGG